MLVRIANREDPDQTEACFSLIWVCAVCLGLFGGQLLFEFLEHLPFLFPCTISHVNLYSQSLTPAPLGFQSELFSKLKGRQSDSDMDEGLPSSPPRTSLTTADVLLGGMFKVYNSFIVLDVSR